MPKAGMLQPGLVAQDLNLVQALPGQFDVVAAKVTIGGRLAIDRSAQVQVLE